MTVAGLAATGLGVGKSAPLMPKGTVPVCVSLTGNPANGDGMNPVITPDGRFVAFDSSASNLVAVDTNNKRDIYVRDMKTSVNILVSIAWNGVQANGVSDLASISSDGRFVEFSSFASNLVPNDTTGGYDIFVRDLQSGTTTGITASPTGDMVGGRYGKISSNGRYVAFSSSSPDIVQGDTNGTQDVFVRDLQLGTTVRVSVSSTGDQANNSSGIDAISADGRFVVFDSIATNLVLGDLNGSGDFFLRDMQAGTTTLLTLNSNGEQQSGANSGASISADGRFVAFASRSANYVPGDTNGSYDIFLRDVTNATTTRVSVSTYGAQAETDCVGPQISPDGRFVTFYSFASNLVSNAYQNYNVFVKDTRSGVLRLASTTPSGSQANNYSQDSFLSSDGRSVTFDSFGTNLVAGFVPAWRQVYVRTLPSFESKSP